MQRILVMGSSGSGKSTFSRRLSEMTGIPTERAQADRYLSDLAPVPTLARVH